LGFSAGVLDLFPEAARRDLLLALAEDGGGAASMITGFSPRGWWVSKEDGDAVQLKVAMPGLGKEHVEMRAEKNVLVIKGEEGDKDSEGDGDKVPARYVYRIGLSSQAFKMDQIKAEMKNGVLMVTVPKIKDEERKDVFEIKIE
jgi:HSP20 family protein